MNFKKTHGALQFLLLFGYALLSLPIALPASKTEVSTNITTSSDKKLLAFFLKGASDSGVTFTEILNMLAAVNENIKKLANEARMAKHEVQTTDLIATIIENMNNLPIDVQDAIANKQNATCKNTLRETLEIMFNEAKALELLENQLSDDCSKRLPWRSLCERVAILLKHNPRYADFVHALISAKDAIFCWVAKLRLKDHLKKLPPRISMIAKEVDRKHPGDVVNRVFWESKTHAA